MKKKLNAVLTALLNAQNYVNNEMEAICDVDAMDESKVIFEELDGAIANVREMLEETADDSSNYIRTWVGYQVKTKDDEFVAPYTDKDVFRTIEDADNLIRSERKNVLLSTEEDDNLVIVSRWLENDDEEKRNFTFHGKKKRLFEKDEKVWDDENNEWVNVYQSTYVSRVDEHVALRDGNKRYTNSADCLYQLADNKTCPRCGGPLCKEHRDHIDYPYYCPDCYENFYEIETR